MDNERNFFHQICKALMFGLSNHSAMFQSVWIQDTNQVKKVLCLNPETDTETDIMDIPKALRELWCLICAIFLTLQQNCRN